MSFSEVILTNNYPQLGFVGDKVRVRRGFARNFLIPQGIAVESSSRRAREVAHVVQGIMAKRARMKKEAEVVAEQLRALNLEFTLSAAKKGRTFGSVSVKDVFDKLKEAGFDLDKKQVRLRDPIKSGGTHIVDVRLHAEVLAEVSAKVIVNLVAEAAPEKDAGKGKRRGKGSRAAQADDVDVDATQSIVNESSAEDATPE
jgi:large subunit ribosomal protein L9